MAKNRREGTLQNEESTVIDQPLNAAQENFLAVKNKKEEKFKISNKTATKNQHSFTFILIGFEI